MKLKELEKTVVYLKTQKEYDELMKICEKAKYTWCDKDLPTSHNYFNRYRRLCVHVQNELEYCSLVYYKNNSFKAISLDEFKTAQGLDTEKTKFKVGDRVKTTGGYTFDPAEGTITDVISPTAYHVKIEKEGTNPNFPWFYRKEQLELIETKKGKFKVGDKVKINWEKTPYLSSGYRSQGQVSDLKSDMRGRIEVKGFEKTDPGYGLGFELDDLKLIKRKGGEKMATSITSVKVGETYTIKVDCRNKCGTFQGTGKYIVITEVDDDGDLYYDILNSGREKIDNCNCFKAEHLERLVTKGGIMKKLKTLARKLLDKDTKDLIRAGILDDCLEVADNGFVLNFLVNHFKKDLAVEARIVIAEQKKEEEK